MSRIVLADFENDVKALKRSSKLMRNRDYNGLVQVIEKFHRDVKLSSLTIKDRTQLIHLGEDAQFYRILIRMLHEITVTTGLKQREDLKKVVQWYNTNKEVLHGHPHFKGATKELYKRPNLSFSKDAMKHYSQPMEKRHKKRVSMATEPRSKSAVLSRRKPGDIGKKGDGTGQGGTVPGARPLTAPPSLHRPKISNSLSSSSPGHGSPTPILEENSFMVNYVNSKLAAYDNYEPTLPRPSSAIGVTKPEILSSEDSSRIDPSSPMHTPNTTSLDSFHHPDQDMAPPATRDSQDNVSIIDSEHLFDTTEGKVEYDERGLPKVVYPLPSLISPFGQEEIIEEESYHGGQSPDKRNKSPLKLTVNVNVPVADNIPPSEISEEETKSINLQKWEEYQARQAFEQELASKQAFFGRGGDPMGVRYIGHDGGEMPEWFTQHVIANYAEEEGVVQQRVQTGEAFHSHPLAEFYKETEKYSPPVRPTSQMSRDETTPDPLEETSPRYEPTRERSASVQFESVVDLAGPVSDSMTMNKEMISPEPQLGYRQPALAINVKHPPMSQILESVDENEAEPTSPSAQDLSSPPSSQTIYHMDQDDRPSTMAPPNSSIFSGSSGDYTQRNRRGQPILQLPEESEYTVHFRRRQRPVTAATIPHSISTRQAARNQSLQKNKCGVEIPNGEQLGKIERTKSAPSRRYLRSAGSTHGGRRPRTALDVSMKQRWNVHHHDYENDGNRVPQAASHVATSVPPKALSSLMVVSHLGGDNRKARSRMGYRGLKGYDENLPGFLPDMQFLSITGPAPLQGRTGQGDSILDTHLEDHLSSNDSKTPSDNASTHPQLDNNLPSHHWNGLSVSTENPDHLSDPFSNKGDDSLAGGSASERSSLLSGVESDRMKDLDDIESPRPDEDNDTPRTMDADLDSDLEAAEHTARSVDSAFEEKNEEVTVRTIDIDMRSVSHVHTEHEEQSAMGSQFGDQESVKNAEDHAISKDQNADQSMENKDQYIESKDPNVGDPNIGDQSIENKDQITTNDQIIDNNDQLTDTKDYNEQIIDSEHNEQSTVDDKTDAFSTSEALETNEDQHPSRKDLESTEEGRQNTESSPDNNDNEVLYKTDDYDPSEIPSEKDILTGAEKADFLSRSFLAVTRNRRVERPSSAHSSLCPTHRLMAETVSSGIVYTKGLKSQSTESIRSLPAGLVYMSMTDEHRGHLEKILPLQDADRYSMMPSVSKKHLTPRSTPNASPRSSPLGSVGVSPRNSRESFRDSPSGSRGTSPNSLAMKIHLNGSNHGDSDSDADSLHHFRPIVGDDGDTGARNSPLLVPPNILVRRPTSAPMIRSPRQDTGDISSCNPRSPRPTSARHRSVSPHPPTSSHPTSARHRSLSPCPPLGSRPTSPRSPRGLSPNPDASPGHSPRSLSPRPTSSRRPRSASPRSPSGSPRTTSPHNPSVSRPSSAKELQVSSSPARPLSPRNRTGPEWKGRPLAVYGVRDPVVEEEELRKQKAAKESVSIQNLFGKSATKSHKKEKNKHDKERQEKKRKEEIERMRTYNEHMWRRDMALIRHKSPIDKDWERDYMMDKLFKQRMREEKWNALKKQQAMENRRAQSYLKRIGPTVDIWDMFHGEKRGVSRIEFKKAAIVLQKYIKGWIVRNMLQRVSYKSRVHAGSFKSFIQYYNTTLKRIAVWHGIRKPRIHADLWEMDQFMDKKRYYESVFVNRTHPGDEMEYKELDLYFKECDHFPSKREIYNAVLGATRKDPDKPHLKLLEKDVVETTFMIYVPPGTGLKTEKLRKSTWMNPLVQGEEARKLMGSEDVEPTSYLTSIQVVAAAFNERKERELDEIRTQAKKSEEAAMKVSQH